MLTIKQIEIVDQDKNKTTGISSKIEGENTLEKHLRVFRAHSRIFLWRSEVIELLNRCVRLLFDYYYFTAIICTLCYDKTIN